WISTCCSRPSRGPWRSEHAGVALASTAEGARERVRSARCGVKSVAVVVVVVGVLTVCASARASSSLPVVLVPGFMGVRESGISPSYFPTIKAALIEAGADVTEIAPPPLADSEVRGAFLAQQIEAVCARTGAPKVIVIAHSQGGVDVRVALTHTARIAAIATIASPHHGTGVADTVLTWPMPAVRATLGAFAIAWQLGQG